MPYSTGCNTPLSNFESGQNYKDAVDPAGRCLYTYIRRCLYSRKFLGVFLYWLAMFHVQ